MTGRVTFITSTDFAIARPRELNLDSGDKIEGVQLTFIASAKSDPEATVDDAVFRRIKERDNVTAACTMQCASFDRPKSPLFVILNMTSCTPQAQAAPMTVAAKDQGKVGAASIRQIQLQVVQKPLNR